MIRFIRTLSVALGLFACAALPVAASDANGRSYRLHTLDYRIAETLVWEICDRNGGKSSKCYVQFSGQQSINVHGTPEVHSQVVEMLAERDQMAPLSLLFEIVLVQLSDNGGVESKAPVAAHQKRALDAIAEVFPSQKATIVDTGLIRMSKRGQTQLADAYGNGYGAFLSVRSIVGGNDGLTFAIDLEVTQGTSDEARAILASSLSIGEGETVVAGSARTDAESAIVVLLTSKSAE